MILSVQQENSFLSRIKRNLSLDKAELRSHDQAGKQYALDAVAILQEYKTNVHDFTDGIVDFWLLPKKVMDRYHFDDVDQLNEWLDGMS